MTAFALSDILRERIGRHARAGRTALLDPTGSTSYVALGVRIDHYAHAFRDTSRGALVGVPASRSADSVALFFGIMQAGGCPCFVDPGLTAEALLLRAHTVGLRQIVIEEESAATASALEHGGLRVRRAATPSADARGSAANGKVIDESLTASDLAMMQFTTGSTGLPKGALLTHHSLLRHAAGIIERTALTAADRLLHVMPLHHTNGVNNQLIAPFLAGASVVLAERFRAEDIEDQIADYSVTYLTGVPTMYSRALPHLRERREAALATIPPLRLGAHRGAPARGGRSRVRRAADRVVRVVRGDVHVDHEPGRRATHRDRRHRAARPTGPDLHAWNREGSAPRHRGGDPHRRPLHHAGLCRRGSGIADPRRMAANGRPRTLGCGRVPVRHGPPQGRDRAWRREPVSALYRRHPGGASGRGCLLRGRQAARRAG